MVIYVVDWRSRLAKYGAEAKVGTLGLVEVHVPESAPGADGIDIILKYGDMHLMVIGALGVISKKESLGGFN